MRAVCFLLLLGVCAADRLIRYNGAFYIEDDTETTIEPVPILDYCPDVSWRRVSSHYILVHFDNPLNDTIQFDVFWQDSGHVSMYVPSGGYREMDVHTDYDTDKEELPYLQVTVEEGGEWLSCQSGHVPLWFAPPPEPPVVVDPTPTYEEGLREALRRAFCSQLKMMRIMQEDIEYAGVFGSDTKEVMIGIAKSIEAQRLANECT